mgnify:CR=1 FL=1
MRTTVTLDSDVEQLLKARMQREGISFKRALNDAVRAGEHRESPARVDAFTTDSLSLGAPLVDLDRALQVAAELEDADLVGRMRAGS